MELSKSRIKQYTIRGDTLQTREETQEIIVPDVKPDILRILYTASGLTVSEKVMQAGKLRLSGEIAVTVLYAAENITEMVGMDGVIPFSYVLDAEGCDEKDIALLTCELCGCEAVLLNPRKISCRAQIEIAGAVYQKDEAVYVSACVSDPAEKVNARIESHAFDVVAGVAERKMYLSEEIKITGGAIAPGDRILRCEAQWLADDVKVLQNKIMLRGNAKVKVVAMSEKSAFVSQNTYNLPFSQIIEAEGADLTDEVTVEFTTTGLTAKTVERPEGGLFLSVDASCFVGCVIRRQIKTDILTDLYSTAYEAEQKTAEVLVRSGEETYRYELDVSDKIEPSDEAAHIMDYSVACSLCKPRRGDGVLSARAYVKVLYETVTGDICSAGKTIEVSLPLSAPIGDVVRCVWQCEAVKVLCDGTGAILIEFVAVFRPTCAKTVRFSQVTESVLKKESCKIRPNNASLILRNYMQGERVWDIAKSYNTSAQEIFSANKIESEADLVPGKLIIIPFSD